MSKTVKIVITMVIMVMFITLSTVSMAADYSVGLSLTSNSKLVAGGTVVVNVNATAINAGNGVDALTAKLVYDTNVFETLSTTDFNSNTGWNVTFAPSTGKMTVLKNSKITAAETIFTVTLKVKAGANIEIPTTITLQDIVFSGGIPSNGGTGDIETDNHMITLSKAEEPVEKTDVVNPEKNVKPVPTNSATTTTTTTDSTVADSTVVKKSDLPKTGLSLAGIISIAAVAVTGIASLVVYRKMSKEIR